MGVEVRHDVVRQHDVVRRGGFGHRVEVGGHPPGEGRGRGVERGREEDGHQHHHRGEGQRRVSPEGQGQQPEDPVGRGEVDEPVEAQVHPLEGDRPVGDAGADQGEQVGRHGHGHDPGPAPPEAHQADDQPGHQHHGGEDDDLGARRRDPVAQEVVVGLAQQLGHELAEREPAADGGVLADPVVLDPLTRGDRAPQPEVHDRPERRQGAGRDAEVDEPTAARSRRPVPRPPPGAGQQGRCRQRSADCEQGQPRHAGQERAPGPAVAVEGHGRRGDGDHVGDLERVVVQVVVAPRRREQHHQRGGEPGGEGGHRSRRSAAEPVERGALDDAQQHQRRDRGGDGEERQRRDAEAGRAVDEGRRDRPHREDPAEGRRRVVRQHAVDVIRRAHHVGPPHLVEEVGHVPLALELLVQGDRRHRRAHEGQPPRVGPPPLPSGTGVGAVGARGWLGDRRGRGHGCGPADGSAARRGRRRRLHPDGVVDGGGHGRAWPAGVDISGPGVAHREGAVAPSVRRGGRWPRRGVAGAGPLAAPAPPLLTARCARGPLGRSPPPPCRRPRPGPARPRAGGSP